MQCPNCGGEVWNNAQKNVQRASEGKKPLPAMACKDKDNCGWVKWPPKNQGQQGGGNGAGPRASGNGQRASSRPLGPLYNECLTFAKKAVLFHLPQAQPADVIAAAATLLIQATRDGSSIMPPKPKPAPPPEPEYDESSSDDMDESQIPF